MDDSKERQEVTPEQVEAIITDTQFGLQDWIRKLNTDKWSFTIRSHDSFDTLEVSPLGKEVSIVRGVTLVLPPHNELLAFAATPTSPDDVLVEYDFDSRKGAWTPYTSFSRGYIQVSNGIKMREDQLIGYPMQLPHDAISKNGELLIAS